MSDKVQNTQARPFNPDDRPLPHPADTNTRQSVSTVPRKIFNPDQKLLVPPSPEQLQAYQQNKDHQDLRVVGKSFGQKVAAQAHELGDKAKKVEQKVQKKVGQVISDIRHFRFDWVNVAVLVAIVGFAVHQFRH